MVQNVLTGKKYCPPTTLPKWGSKILGGTWHFFGLPPQRAVPLIRPVLITPQWTPVFKWGELPPIWGRYGCLKIWKFLDGCMGHATWQQECTTLTGKVLSTWVLVNMVTHMHTYIIPYKPTPITLSVNHCRYSLACSAKLPNGLYTLCLKKNDNDVAHYNFNAHLPILVIFCRDVAEWVRY